MKRFAFALLVALIPSLALAQPDWGVFQDGGTLPFLTNTVGTDGVAETIASEDLVVVKDAATVITAGITIDDDVSLDFGGGAAAKTGLHKITIDTTQTGYTVGSSYAIIYKAGTVDSVSTANRIIGTFRLGTTAADVEADTQDIQSTLGNVTYGAAALNNDLDTLLTRLPGTINSTAITNFNTTFNTDYATNYDPVVHMWNVDVEKVFGVTPTTTGGVTLADGAITAAKLTYGGAAKIQQAQAEVLAAGTISSITSGTEFGVTLSITPEDTELLTGETVIFDNGSGTLARRGLITLDVGGNSLEITGGDYAGGVGHTFRIVRSASAISGAVTLADGAITANKIATDAFTASKFAGNVWTEMAASLLATNDGGSKTLNERFQHLDKDISDVESGGGGGGGPILQRRTVHILQVKDRGDGTFGVTGEINVTAGEPKLLWALEFKGTQLPPGQDLFSMDEPELVGDEADKATIGTESGSTYGECLTQAKFELRVHSDATATIDGSGGTLSAPKIKAKIRVKFSASDDGIDVYVPVNVKAAEE